MPITFRCPSCQKSLTVSDAGAGRAGKCPHCKSPMQVPTLNSTDRAKYVIQVSARIIRWPEVCACCCERSDASLEIEHVRLEGIKVVRPETKREDVPYCKRCLAHLGLEDAIQAAEVEEGYIATRPVFPAAVLPVEPRKPRTSIIDGLALWLVGCGTIFIVFVGGPWLLLCLRWGWPLGTFAMSIPAVLLLLVMGSLCRQWYGRHRQRAAEEVARYQAFVAQYEVQRKAMQAEHEKAEVVHVQEWEHATAAAHRKTEAVRERHRALLRPSCCQSGKAVVYEGWEGSIHTFLFSNPIFVNAFVKANEGKVI